jgi:hypothetical protein
MKQIMCGCGHMRLQTLWIETFFSRVLDGILFFRKAIEKALLFLDFLGNSSINFLKSTKRYLTNSNK